MKEDVIRGDILLKVKNPQFLGSQNRKLENRICSPEGPTLQCFAQKRIHVARRWPDVAIQQEPPRPQHERSDGVGANWGRPGCLSLTLALAPRQALDPEEGRPTYRRHVPTNDDFLLLHQSTPAPGCPRPLVPPSPRRGHLK